jgi:hypothetical protein
MIRESPSPITSSGPRVGKFASDGSFEFWLMVALFVVGSDVEFMGIGGSTVSKVSFTDDSVTFDGVRGASEIVAAIEVRRDSAFDGVDGAFSEM